MPSNPKTNDYIETGIVTRKIVNPAETTTVEQRIEWALFHIRNLKRKNDEITRELDTLTRLLRAEPYEVVDDGRRVRGWTESKDDWKKVGEALAEANANQEIAQ